MKGIPVKEIVKNLKGHIFSALRLPQPRPVGAQMVSNLEGSSSPKGKADDKVKGPAESNEKNKSLNLSPAKASSASAGEKKTAPSAKGKPSPQKGDAQAAEIDKRTAPMRFAEANRGRFNDYPQFRQAFAKHAMTETVDLS